MTKLYVWFELGLSKLKDALMERSSSLRDSRGATAVEYALIIGLIAVVIILAVQFLGGTIRDIFNRVGSSISGK